MDGSNAKVYINGALSRSFPVTPGVINLAIHSVIGKLNSNTALTHSNICISY